MRSRRGRGVRGPLVLPGPLAPHGVPMQRTRRERFDDVVAELVELIEPRFAMASEAVEVVVEDVPLLPQVWDEPVPLGQVIRETTPTRVVVYRLPITQRADDPEMLKDIAWAAVLDGLAEVWSVPPESLDPRAR